MTAGKTSHLDDRIYVWSKSNGMRVGTGCIISAHGCQTIINQFFTVPLGVRIFFYTPHGHALFVHKVKHPNSPYYVKSSLVAIMSGKAVPEPKVYMGGELCPNYLLDKSQLSTQGCANGAVTNALHSRHIDSYDDLEYFLNTVTPSMSVVTVRNRPFKSGVCVRSIVMCLTLLGYKNFHCAFCRDARLVPRAFYKGNDRGLMVLHYSRSWLWDPLIYSLEEIQKYK